MHSEEFPLVIRSRGLKRLLSKRRTSPQNNIYTSGLIFEDELPSNNIKNYASAPVIDQIRPKFEQTDRFYGLYNKLEGLKLSNEIINRTPSPNNPHNILNNNYLTRDTHPPRYEGNNSSRTRDISPEIHTIEPRDALQIQKKFHLLAKFAGEPHYYSKPEDLHPQRIIQDTRSLSNQRQNKWNIEHRNPENRIPGNIIKQATVISRNNMKADDQEITTSTTDPSSHYPAPQITSKDRLRGFTASPISPRTPTPVPGEGQGGGQGGHWQERVMCRKHPGYMISYICVQERCGELLCQECKREHEEEVHEGEFQTLQNFKKSVALQLNQACDSLLNSSSNIEELQIGVKEKEDFYGDLTEKISMLEENVMNNVQEYFGNLKREFENQVYIEVGRTRENLDGLQSTIVSMVVKLKQDFQSLIFEKDSPEISLHKLTKIIKDSYISSSDDFQSEILEVEEKIEKFLNYQKHNSRKKSKTTIEVEGSLLSNLEAVLSKDIRIVKKQSISSEAPPSSQRQERGRPGAPPIVNRRNKEKNVNMLNQYKSQNEAAASSKNNTLTVNLKDLKNTGIKGNKTRAMYQKAKKQMNAEGSGGQNDRKSRTLTPVRDPVMNIPEKEKAHTPQWKSNTMEDPNMNIKIRKYSDNSRPDTQRKYSTESDREEDSRVEVKEKKEINTELMEYLVEHMSGVYQSNKVKVLPYGFIEKLLNLSEAIDLNNFRKKRPHFDQVAEYLQTKGKSKTIFTAYEKVLFLMNVQEMGWTLIEVKRTPKVIILYDFLGKFSINRYGENLMEKIFEVIKHEYKMKLNQDVDIFMWDRKIAKDPSLVEKDPGDTGILTLEMVANAYQDKGALKGKIGDEAVKKMRQNIEKIIAAFESH